MYQQQCFFFIFARIVKLWKEDLGKINKKAADSLADPSEYENLFPEFQEALQAEQVGLLPVSADSALLVVFFVLCLCLFVFQVRYSWLSVSSDSFVNIALRQEFPQTRTLVTRDGRAQHTDIHVHVGCSGYTSVFESLLQLNTALVNGTCQLKWLGSITNS